LPLAAWPPDDRAQGRWRSRRVRTEEVRTGTPEIYFYDLGVLENYRRRGIATGMINKLREIAREIGSYVIFVQADHGDDPAIKLYESLGTLEDVLHFDIIP
jgi:aminoglycoside 3-N-acetyltransferase I